MKNMIVNAVPASSRVQPYVATAAGTSYEVAGSAAAARAVATATGGWRGLGRAGVLDGTGLFPVAAPAASARKPIPTAVKCTIAVRTGTFQHDTAMKNANRTTGSPPWRPPA